MAEQQQWFAGKPEENFGLALASDTEAYGGHLGKARELTKRAVDSAIRADSKENGAIWQAIAAQREAAYGNAAEARQSAAEALKLAPASQGVESRSRACVCHGGRYGASRILGARLGETLPAGHADAVALAACDSGAIGAEQKESGCRPECPASCFPHRVGANCVRHQYFLPLSTYMYAERHTWQPDRAALPPPSFRRFSTTAASSGTAGRERWRIWEWLVPTRLQARTSQGADADAARVRALAAYKDFLTLWKDADPDIPILKEAKAEYAKLQ